MTMPGVGNDHPDNPETLARTAIERQNLYGFLATIFREELTAELLGRIKSEAFRKALDEAGVELDAEFLERPEAELLEELAIEYTLLFLGPGGHISPHESVHVAGGGGLWGEATVEVKKFIEYAGFAYDEDYHGLPDHISVELDFMADVAGQEAAAWEEGDVEAAANCLEFEDRFMNDHIGKWVFAFCRKVTERAEHPFYRRMARLAADFLEAEKQEIARRSAIATGSPGR